MSRLCTPRPLGSAPVARRILVALAAGSLALAVAACGNISLSDASLAGAGAPSPYAPLIDNDAALDGGSTGAGDAGPAQRDAANGVKVVGSALCNYDVTSPASHNCIPDDSSQCGLSDAGTVPGDSGYPADAALLACHVVKGSGPPTQTCTAAGSGRDGDQCQSGTDCEASYECVGMPGRCRRYCCEGDTAHTCGALTTPSFCDLQPVAAQTFRVPVCVPVSNCQLFAGTCTSGQTCAVARDDGTTSCVTVGPQAAGESCELDHCDKGLTCLGSVGSRTCFKLCRIDWSTDCPSPKTCTGSAQLFQDPAFGICQ